MYRSLSVLEQQQIRAGASYNLSREMAGSGCGISSSDINHAMFELWKNMGKNKKAYVNEGKNLYAERLNEVIHW